MQVGPWHMTSGRALLLIADIGGYTEYMSTHRMSLAHVEVNTARMLDRVVDAAPGFELIEIEGDGAFLARPADRMGPDEAVAEVVRRPPPCTAPSTSSVATSPPTCAPATAARRRAS